MATKQEIKDFSDIIERLKQDLDTGYMDAITHHCQETGLEIEVAASLITPALKAKIREEAMEINLLKKTSRSKLPL